MGRKKIHLTEEDRLQAQRNYSMKYYMNNVEEIKKKI